MNDPFSSTIITLLLLAALAFMLGKRRLGLSLLGCAGTLGAAALALVILTVVVGLVLLGLFWTAAVAIFGTCGGMLNHH